MLVSSVSSGIAAAAALNVSDPIEVQETLGLLKQVCEEITSELNKRPIDTEQVILYENSEVLSNLKQKFIQYRKDVSRYMDTLGDLQLEGGHLADMVPHEGQLYSEIKAVRQDIYQLKFQCCGRLNGYEGILNGIKGIENTPSLLGQVVLLETVPEAEYSDSDNDIYDNGPAPTVSSTVRKIRCVAGVKKFVVNDIQKQIECFEKILTQIGEQYLTHPNPEKLRKLINQCSFDRLELVDLEVKISSYSNQIYKDSETLRRVLTSIRLLKSGISVENNLYSRIDKMERFIRMLLDKKYEEQTLLYHDAIQEIVQRINQIGQEMEHPSGVHRSIAPSAAPAASKVESNDDDDIYDHAPISKAPSAAPAASKVESNDDDDIYDHAPISKAPSAAPAASKVESNDDDDIYDHAPISKAPSAAPAASKVESNDDDIYDW